MATAGGRPSRLVLPWVWRHAQHHCSSLLGWRAGLSSARGQLRLSGERALWKCWREPDCCVQGDAGGRSLLGTAHVHLLR